MFYNMRNTYVLTKTTTITDNNKTSKQRECKQLRAQEKCFESNFLTLK